jgi:phage shock protein E
MIQFLKNLFGFGERINLGDLIANGATIIDVRTVGEYRNGHLKMGINVPLAILPNQFTTLDKTKPIITCCASGMRSASAKRMLNNNGFLDVHNGGNWMSLKQFEN